MPFTIDNCENIDRSFKSIREFPFQMNSHKETIVLFNCLFNSSYNKLRLIRYRDS